MPWWIHKESWRMYSIQYKVLLVSHKWYPSCYSTNLVLTPQTQLNLLSTNAEYSPSSSLLFFIRDYCCDPRFWLLHKYLQKQDICHWRSAQVGKSWPTEESWSCNILPSFVSRYCALIIAAHLSIFNAVLSAGIVPSIHKRGVISIFKSGDRENITIYL